MGFRFRKSISLGGGVRLNLSKRGFGFGAGPRGLRLSLNTHGKLYGSAGIPGSGLYFVKTASLLPGKGRSGHRRGSSGRQSRQTSALATAPPVLPARPGVLAPRYEKDFYRAAHAYVEGREQEALELFEKSSSEDNKERALSDDFLAGVLACQLDKVDSAIPHLEKVVAHPESVPDELMKKYGVGGTIPIPVTPKVIIHADFDSLAAVLLLAESYQYVGRVEEAIGLLQQVVDLHRDIALVLSLCELYYITSAWQDLIDLAAGTQNTDDVTLQILVYEARAMWEIGHKDAAIEVYKAALRARKRDPRLLREARYCRGALYYELGKKALAKADFVKVYAEDPSYEQVEDWLKAVE